MRTDQTPKATMHASRGKTQETRDALLKAGIRLLALQGYEATSTRQIELAAGVQRNLITYHFGKKEAFWKACMVAINTQMAAELNPAVDQSQDLAPLDRVRYLIRRYVRASAQYPEIGRIMFDEGRCDSWRLRWIVDNYGRYFFNTVCRMFEEARAEGALPDVPAASFYYMLVSSAAVFTLSAECKLLTDEMQAESLQVEAHAEAVVRLLTRANR